MSISLQGTLEVVWSSPEPVLFTVLEVKPFAKVWKPWRPRSLQLRADGTMLYLKAGEIKGKIDLSSVYITKMGIDNPDFSKLHELSIVREVGIHVLAGEVTWRCILPETELEKFTAALHPLATHHNIESLQRNLTRAISTELSLHSVQQGGVSVMRRAVAKAMEKLDTRTKHQETLSRRGALKWMPVLFDNDLIHGSWWFAIGSIFVVIAASVVLANGFNDKFLGDDNSNLSDFHYRATWFLILISGLFFTAGSLAFVRAVHEPPLQPAFPRCYHLQNDELIGSWFFLLGVVPLLPYCFIFLIEAESQSQKAIFTGGLFFSVLLFIGACLFVRACYPSTAARSQKFVTSLRYCLGPLLCQCGDKILRKHLPNDWLAGCWILLWATLMATIACLVLFIQSLREDHTLLIFIYGTSLGENVMFLIGSAYFVSGSYPLAGAVEDIEVEDPSYFLINSERGTGTVHVSSRT